MPTSPQPLVRLEMVPHLDTTAVRAQGRFRSSAQRMREVLLDFPRFSHWVPLIERGSIQSLGDERYRCGLHGRLGIWKLGIAIDMQFEMERVGVDEIRMTRYLGGSFNRLHFHHWLRPDAEGGELESLYFFDLEGFPLLKHINALKRYPWLANELQLTASSMMVRGLIQGAEAGGTRARAAG